MSQKETQSSNIRPFKKKRELNLGIILFSIVLIYLLITVMMYLTSKHVSAYEVREGSILKDNSYTGLVLREETVVHTESSGYVTYFISEKSKIRRGTSIFTLSDAPLDTQTSTGADSTFLSGSHQIDFLSKIQNFSNTFKESDFTGIYTLKSEILSALQPINNQTMVSQLDELLASNSGSHIQVSSSERDGIILFHIDGYEEVTPDTFQDSNLVKAELETTILDTGDHLDAGDAVYKLVTGEIWSIIVEIDEETRDLLSETTSMKTRIGAEREISWADLSLIEKKGHHYACLTYDHSMIRYASDRFLDVELILEDESGLKIPKTSVTQKSFYEVPSEYLTREKNSSATGVLVKSKEKSSDTFLEIGTYFYSADQTSCYLDSNLFEKNTTLVHPKSQETIPLKTPVKLDGVYNINKGYVVFKRVEILCENDDYYIISDHTENGLSNYDHIALDAATVEENEIIFQ
ncbi:MAG: hypothetical protein HFH53_06895 [Hespellia sp.]|nr:hypothetical protein [Hespellia sp.]